MSQLTVDIVARVNDTLKKLGLTEKQIEQVNAALKQTAPSAKQATAAMNDLGAASAKAGNAAKGSSQKFFQAGQAISDFSVAGIRGAANNFEFLALQLGLSGPLLLSISAATSALVVFGDDIVKALNPIGTKAKEIRAELSDLLSVISEDRPDLVLLERQLPGAIENVKQQIEDLNKQIQNRLGNQDPGALSQLFPSLFASEAEQRQLADLKAVLEDFEDRYSKLQIQRRAFEAAGRSDAVTGNKGAADELRARLESLGLQREAEKLSNKALLIAIEQGKVEELIAKLKKQHANATREEVTELDRAQKKVQELASELDQRRRGELDTLTALRDQARALQAQIELVKRLDEARKQQAERGTPQRAQAAAQQNPDISVAEFLRQQQARERERQAGLLEARALPDGVAQDVAERTAEAQRALQAEFATSIALADELAAAINYGLSDSLVTLADAFGTAITSSEGFDGIGNTVLLTLADLAGNVGRIAIGTGIAIEGIKKALQTLNPIVAIGAGVALVALSAAVKSKLSKAGGGSGGYGGGSNFGAGGASSSLGGASQQRLDALGFERLPNGAVVPAGSFQPSAPQAPGYTPLAPSTAQRVIVEGTFDLEGENLRAAVRNTDKRVEKTRGVAA